MKERMSLAVEPSLRRRVEREAKRRGVSVSRMVTEILAERLGEAEDGAGRDPIFQSIPLPRRARRVPDAAIDHDRYAYDPKA